LKGSEKKSRADSSAEAGEDVLSQAFFRDRNVADEGKGPGESRLKIFRRMAVYLVPVLVLLFVIDLAARKLFPPEKLLPYMQKDIAFYTLKVDRFLEKPAPDLLVLGSSRTRKGVNARLLSHKLTKYWGRPARAFNLGLDGAMAEEIYALLTSHMHDPPPPYVVICLSGMEVTQAHNFRFAPRFLWKLPNFIGYLFGTSFEDFSAESVEYYIESILCNFWYLFNHRDAFMKMVAEKAGVFLGVESSINEAEMRASPRRQESLGVILADYGYKAEHHQVPNWEEQMRADPKKVPKISKERLEKDEALFTESSVELVRKIVEQVRAMGSKLILVEIPPSPIDQRTRSMMGGEKFRAWMNGVADELGVTFITMPAKETGLTNALYIDASHLNARGADRYTHLLFDKIRAAGFLEE
jgi:hypothetical protein